MPRYLLQLESTEDNYLLGNQEIKSGFLCSKVWKPIKYLTAIYRDHPVNIAKMHNFSNQD